MTLIKFTLSFTVVFSAVISYLLAPGITFNIVSVLLLLIGGMLITGSANAINQIAEKDTDGMMKRTAKRPVASGKMSVSEASAFAAVAGALGVYIIGAWFNWTAAMIGLFSLFLYGFVYTPLKKVHSVSVLVGAVPGALPCLIGWVAGTDSLSVGGWALFAIQFFWQFPHFWAIAWVAHNDYSRAGFKLMPSDAGPTRYSAIQAVIYSLLMVPAGLVPYFIGMSGQVSLVIILLANLFMVWQSIRLYREMSVPAARRVMFSSYIYLPIVLLSLLADKVAGV
ncbi:MAG: heme o synthase [Chitinophagaceae bacterium]|nr:heme o synthase [Chitinophagaceae bacterium]MCW5929299.1 heme o synthase [Chitinophagaceae bacterium]